MLKAGHVDDETFNSLCEIQSNQKPITLYREARAGLMAKGA